MKNLIKFAAAAAIVVAALSIAGRADYDEAVAARQQYCDMVAKGHWPDFRDSYEQACQ